MNLGQQSVQGNHTASWFLNFFQLPNNYIQIFFWSIYDFQWPTRGFLDVPCGLKLCNINLIREYKEWISNCTQYVYNIVEITSLLIFRLFLR